jgi:thioredoxin 1
MEISKKGMVAVKFSATWCGPCKALEPLFEKMKGEFANVDFQTIDVDDHSSLAKEYKILSVPTVICLRDGQEIDRLVGKVNASALRKSLRDFAQKAAA